MQNMKVKQDGDKLIIEVDLTQTQGPSKSGKSEIIATSAGAVNHNGVQINLNVYRPR